MNKRLQGFFYSFPIQLLVLHFKKNVLTLSFWIVIVLFITGGIGNSFGLKYLFLDPEYLNQVNFWSFFFIGLAFAGFVTSWNITTYLLQSKRFPFLASLHRPFIKFCINNAVLPIGFVVFYFYKMSTFQSSNDASTEAIIEYMFGFGIGYFVAILIFALYFIATNKDIFSYDVRLRYKRSKFIRGLVDRRNKSQEPTEVDKNKWRVDYYINGRLKTRRVRSVMHYNQELLGKVFNQHHKNATLLQLVSIVALIGLGFLMDYSVFRIPAGASVLILFAMLTSVLGALWYWLNGWHTFIIILLLVTVNYITILGNGKYRNKAYGLDYSKISVYNNDSLKQVFSIDNIQADKDSTLVILENWRAKFGKEKPKMVLVGVSGGGLRASVWTMRVLQHTDSLLNGQLMNHTTVMTGASGGMIGATYYRSLYYEASQNRLTSNLYNNKHLYTVAKDLQNSILFSIAVNDIFVPWSSFKLDGIKYPKDRGYIFEKQLNENTNDLLDKRLSFYKNLEKEAKIPILFFSPVLANDGKRLLIGAQNLSYLTASKSTHQNQENVEFDGLDFNRFFNTQKSANLRLTSAIRMSATYPYVLPNVTLPTAPIIEVMDAGWRDNYGVDLPIRFTHIFKDWIKENTSGIVFVQIRAAEKIDKSDAEMQKQGIINSMINPLGLAGKFMDMQDFHQDAMLDYITDIYDEHPVEVIPFTYRPYQLTERASMSFHLTEKEKIDIIQAIYNSDNQKSLKRLQLRLSK